MTVFEASLYKAPSFAVSTVYAKLEIVARLWGARSVS